MEWARELGLIPAERDGTWGLAHYNLVLAFDEKDLLDRHALIQMKKVDR